MKNYLPVLLFLMLFFPGPAELRAQDPEFSQFYAIPMYTNPAFAGNMCGRVAAAYRNQYPTLPGGYVTFNASYDQREPNIGGGYGIMFTNDKAGEGVLTVNSVNASYAYEVAFKDKKHFARFGMQAGFFQKSLQWDKLRWGDQIITQLGFVNPTGETRINKAIISANFAAGGLIYSDRFYAGLACHNITQPTQSFFTSSNSILPRRFTIHGGLVVPLDNKREPEATFSPNILIMAQQKFTQANVGFYINKNQFVTGLWFRDGQQNPDALILLIGFRQGDFKFGYSMDFTVSKLQSAGKNAFEFSAIYEFCNPKRPEIKYRNLPCPTF
jgi:type IX secretion system PorP/SprF family membrane protein